MVERDAAPCLSPGARWCSRAGGLISGDLAIARNPCTSRQGSTALDDADAAARVACAREAIEETGLCCSPPEPCPPPADRTGGIRAVFWQQGPDAADEATTFAALLPAILVTRIDASPLHPLRTLGTPRPPPRSSAGSTRASIIADAALSVTAGATRRRYARRYPLAWTDGAAGRSTGRRRVHRHWCSRPSAISPVWRNMTASRPCSPARCRHPLSSPNWFSATAYPGSTSPRAATIRSPGNGLIPSGGNRPSLRQAVGRPGGLWRSARNLIPDAWCDTGTGVSKNQIGFAAEQDDVIGAPDVAGRKRMEADASRSARHRNPHRTVS